MSQHKLLLGHLSQSKTPVSLDNIMQFVETWEATIPRSTIRARLAELRLKDMIFQNPDSHLFSIKTREQLETQFAGSIQCVNLVGIELEGGWDNRPHNFHGDPSVSCSGEIVGETISDPMKLSEALAWTTKNYPNYSNRSCGIHVHLSFSNRLAYMQMLDKKFYDQVFLPQAEIWGKNNKVREGSAFWDRLSGNNRFCLKGFEGEKQAKLTSKNTLRYRHLNYCWNIHNTLECRLFPCFQAKDKKGVPKLAHNAIRFFYHLANNYLKAQKPEPRVVEEITVEVQDESQETKICV